MKIEKLHYEVRRQWQMHNSYRRGMPDNKMDLVIQDAISVYFNYYAFGMKPNHIDFGAESDFQRSDMLSTLLTTQVILPGSVINDGSIPFAKPSNFGTYQESYVNTSCGKLDVNIRQHSDMNEVLRSYHRRPSKKFKKARGFLRDKIYVFVPEDITVESIQLYYYKYPAKVCLGTYPDIPDVGQSAGANLPKVQCDLPENYHHLVVSIAVQELDRVYGDTQRLQLQNQKILSTT